MPVSQRLIKLIKSLQKKPIRDQNRLFVAEGELLCNELVSSSFSTELIVIREPASGDIIELAEKFFQKNVAIYSASKTQFALMCDTKTPQGVIAIVHFKNDELFAGESFIALDGIADPGNVGTIIRTADWFGYKQILLGRDSADKYNSKVVRSTMGSIFHCSIFDENDLVEFIQTNFKGYNLYGASLDATTNLKSIKSKKKHGLIFGGETKGISDNLKEILTDQFKIEGTGSAESLNVAVSVGISLNHFCNLTK